MSDGKFDGRYVVALGESPDELMKNVEDFIEDGWELWGSPFTFPSKKTMLAQALTRIEK